MSELKRLNTRGIPAIESINVTVDGSKTTVTFKNHPYVLDRFAGGFWIKISQNLESDGNNIYFNTSGLSNSEIPLYLPNGDQATGANVASTGQAVYLCFYDRDSNRLTLII